MERELRYLQRVIEELQAEAHHAIIHEQYDRAIGLIYALQHYAERRDFHLQQVRFAHLKKEDEDAQR